ncbi:hypothetical protein HN031_20095 [Nocardioides sp. zg-1308]|uniref:hypothetical protein n=1 Tax=Nocardioides sp. zg-1308 TaxID=2736253 RepID=UPI0015528A98|nr:hypothetical protein [Nocardioides sp. zg-1308]NPD06983.1 hypothetical protein [Nocardioides sp. zg-1308]
MTTQRRTMVVVLAVLVVAAAAVVVWLARSPASPPPDVAVADASDASVASVSVKDAVREAASEAVARAYSYSWETLADDKAAARALMTDSMQVRYDRTMAGVTTSSQEDRTVASADVVDTAVVTASTDAARVLVFVNQSTSAEDLEEPTLDLDRVLVTLERDDGTWKVDELDAL